VRVEFQENGSLQFRGTARIVDFDVARRQVVDTLGEMTKFMSFGEVHQVVLAGPPTGRLALRLSLKRGEVLELGMIEDADFGLRLGARIAKVLGCDFGGVVRVPTLSIRMHETEETEAFVRVEQLQATECAPTQEVPTFRRPPMLALFDEAAQDLLERSWD
jgi:hypothetical protein